MESEYRENSRRSCHAEWVCPDCETRNAGDVCIVCGFSRPVRDTSRKKRILLWILCAAVLAALCAALALWPRYSAYLNACSLLERGEYALAYDAFSSMETYRDSREKELTSLLGWAESLAGEGQYNQALALLQKASSDPAAQALKSEIRFDYGTHLLTQRQYIDAYRQFNLLKDYPGAKDSAWKAIKSCLTETLKNSDVAQAKQLRSVVQLTRVQSADLYSMLCSKPLYSASGSWNSDDFTVRQILMEMLTEGRYPFREELELLFSEYNTAAPSLFVKEHREALEKLWFTSLGQNIITSSGCKYAWMVGTWWDSNYGKYISFTVNDPDSWSSFYMSSNISMVSKPIGTIYWAIWDTTLVWTNDTGSISANVMELTLTGPNTLEVYNYRDGATYTLYRRS